MDLLGTPIQMQVVTNDAREGAEFAICYGGGTTPITVGEDQQVVITDITLVSVAGGIYEIKGGSNSNLGAVVMGNADPKGGIAQSLTTPFFCEVGFTPTLTAELGTVYATMRGYLRRAV